MAFFSDAGAHCSLETCKEKDFLPFTCDICKRVFCLDHRTYTSHQCPFRKPEVSAIVCPVCQKSLRVGDGDEANRVWSLHAERECKPGSSIPICPTKVSFVVNPCHPMLLRAATGSSPKAGLWCVPSANAASVSRTDMKIVTLVKNSLKGADCWHMSRGRTGFAIIASSAVRGTPPSV